MHQNISILIHDFKKLFLDLRLKHLLNFIRGMRNKICKLSGINKVIQYTSNQPHVNYQSPLYYNIIFN